ncbi:Ig-like domain-containing protein [Nocardioides sp. zg-DK7169]|uniref:L,D-transpeptidase n=1 Tax=Nocardioides sp. zg-DK7169 TaxID=2736600 RepID=UPI0015569AB8|nr:Ig-like domain-containing protein [Nocardioides sp. zg-DK7169]NPC95466.1 L,D-transpeptidase family protein [Nocardioides sp. zg-DK7169]
MTAQPSPLRRRGTARTRSVATAALLLSLVALTGAACDASDGTDTDAPGGPGQGVAAAELPALRLTANVRRDAREVPVDRVVEVGAEHGRLSRVRLSAGERQVPGRLTDDGSAWRASARLEPGTAYTLRVVGSDGAGERVAESRSFRTRALSLAEQTFASVAPLDGETVGIGMPVVVTFDVPVTDQATFEKHMTVRSEPQQAGSWHWMSATEARWRPRKYWRPGTRVSVDIDVNSLPAGGGIYGQESRRLAFEVGDAHVYRVDAAAHQMRVFTNGSLVRTFPITTGKEGFTTRSGVKVIMEKSESRRMNSETVGIAAGSADSYDIDNVQWAMRLTTSGEFIHAAPWSVGSQGSANVSHGCTGMSTADAAWLYAQSRRGDVVEYVGTDRPMTVENGWGDWNLPFAEYRDGSALG